VYIYIDILKGARSYNQTLIHERIKWQMHDVVNITTKIMINFVQFLPIRAFYEVR